MKKYNFYLVYALTFCSTCTVAQENKILENPNQSISPIPQVEVGKVKNVPAVQLPPVLRSIAQRDIAAQERGGEIFSDEDFLQRSQYQNRLQYEGNIASKLKIKLSNIQGTELSRYVYEGVIPNGPTFDGPWTNVTRVFRRQDGVVVMLSEWDYVADGGGVITVKELMTEKVRDVPARLIVLKTPSNKAISELTWATDKKYFTISVWNDVKHPTQQRSYGKKWLLSLAQSLPD